MDATIFDVDGRVVRTLSGGSAPRGTGELWWDGRDANGRVEGNGVYLARVAMDRGSTTERLIRIR